MRTTTGADCQTGRNIEQKFRCHDLEAARTSALVAGAVQAETMHQRDVYFRAARGRLKMRWIESDLYGRSCELIGYDRVDEDGERACSYHIVPVSEPARLEALLSAVMVVRAVVNKRRRLLMAGNLRIHLDEVEGLGSFVEFEAVLGPCDDENESRARVVRWRRVLELREPVPVSYVDLLDNQGSAGDVPYRRAEANL